MASMSETVESGLTRGRDGRRGVDQQDSPYAGTDSPVQICLLGSFRVLMAGRPVALRGGGKAEALLCALALRWWQPVPRDVLLSRLWPDSDGPLAGQSLSTLVYRLRRLLGGAIGGRSPVVHTSAGYRLNTGAGIAVDVARFDDLADAGDRLAGQRDGDGAATCWARAVALYTGDLSVSTDVHAVVERERLRARYLALLMRLADHEYRRGDYLACLERALQVLASDPCREGAHRLAIRCYMQQGERAQALRQYLLCRDVLRQEFDTSPEPATTALFDQVRNDPLSV
jgi:DNA-binding SARP family transcriptional activator